MKQYLLSVHSVESASPESTTCAWASRPASTAPYSNEANANQKAAAATPTTAANAPR